VTGNSGGGNLSTYLMVLDDRVKAAMPVCWLTQYRPLLAGRGPQDAEQNVRGFIAAGFDLGDYVLAREPAAVQVGAAIRDATFPIGGVRAMVAESRRLAGIAGGTVELAEADEEHAYSKPLREAGVRWFRKQFFGVDEPIHEPEPFPIRSEQDLWATPNG